MRIYLGEIQDKIYQSLPWIIMLPFILIGFFSVKSARFLDPVVFIFSLLFFYQLIIYPKRGLLILPFVIYILPESFRVLGLSPGFLLSIFTLSGIFLHVSLQKLEFKISWIWILLFLIVLIEEILYGDYTKNFIQGILPFMIFSIIIKSEKEGRRVLQFWLIAFSLFSVIYLLRAAININAGSLLHGLANIRNMQFSGHNPNNIGWTAMLYLPLAFAFAKNSKKGIQKILWWVIFFLVVLMLIFTFSRASMAGMVLIFFLLVFFFPYLGKPSFSFFLPLIIPLFSIYFIWTFSISVGVMDSSREFSYEILSPEFLKRWNMVKMGFDLAFNPVENQNNNLSVSTHSLFAKVIYEYGKIFFIIILIPFFYLIKTNFKIRNTIKDYKLRILSSCILVGSINAAIQGIFGITLFAAQYAQVFWLILGYTYLLNQKKINIA